MRIIARKALRDFGDSVPLAKAALDSWYHEVSAAEWKTPADVKDMYRSASIIANNRVVFNISGNRFRLIVKINYRLSIIFIRFVGTHAEYDEIDAEEV